MPSFPLAGRRIHIAGSVHDDPAIASTAEGQAVGAFVTALVADLMRDGASFVVPLDDLKTRDADGLPLTFDWLVFQAIQGNLHRRPASLSAESLVVAVKHHKSEEQVPTAYAQALDDLRASGHVHTVSAAHWNMASKRMDIQALYGDVLIALGGSEGVTYLANLYHETGRPVIPLNFKLTPPGVGARRLFDLAQTREHGPRFFRLTEDADVSDRINQLDFAGRHDTTHRVATVMRILRELERPTAFAVRLLDAGDTENYQAVEDQFSGVVKPFVEDELGYRLVVIDQTHRQEAPFITQEIFNRLHRAELVVADLTGLRPNCFLELGYALGRQHQLMVLARAGTKLPFDTAAVDTAFWSPESTLVDRRTQLRQHWQRVRNRRSLVEASPLVP